HRHERGVSLIELMVSVAIGLILVAGALTLFTTNVVGSRKLTVEARVNQDLRAAADLIARDVRRAGYWANAISGTITTGTGNTTPPTPKAAPTTACPNPPTLTMHRFDILIEGNAKSDSTLKRTLRESVRVRNDQFSGSCP